MMAHSPTTMAYLSLFLAAFVAATLLPAQSEALLGGLLATQRHSVAGLIAVATVGNVLGAITNWIVGHGIERFGKRRWFPANAAQLEKAQRWYRRYGKWSLLLSWAPLIGDVLTVAAGVLREPLATFVLLVTIAKLMRYIVVAAVVLQWMRVAG